MRWIAALVMLLGLNATAFAQAEHSPTEHAWSRGTTLELFGGAAMTSSRTGGAFGAALAWEVTHRFEIEGTGTWVREHGDLEGFAADLKVRANLTRPGTFVPYVAAGYGLYRSIVGAFSEQVPAFYRRRMTAAGETGNTSYTDPAALVGAGVHLYVAEHFSLKPEVLLRFVMDDSQTHRFTTATIAVVYHVERHVSSARHGVR